MRGRTDTNTSSQHGNVAFDEESSLNVVDDTGILFALCLGNAVTL